MSRTRKRADRIRREVPIVRVLYDLGYQVRPDGDDREQQFACDLHGDGHDGKPSARCYPSTNLASCFACSATRDAITLTMIKRNMTISNALSYLEKSYGLPPLAWDEEDESISKPDQIQESLREHVHLGPLVKRVHSILDAQRNDRVLSLREVLGFWEVSDMIEWHFDNEEWQEDKAIQEMSKLLDKLKALIHGKLSGQVDHIRNDLGGSTDSQSNPQG